METKDCTLKACPFCGGTAWYSYKWWKNGLLCWIECNVCGAKTKAVYEQADFAWYRKADNKEVSEFLEEEGAWEKAESFWNREFRMNGGYSERELMEVLKFVNEKYLGPSDTALLDKLKWIIDNGGEKNNASGS